MATTASTSKYKRCLRVSVISPGHRAGSSTISILLALLFAYTQGKKTVLTHTSSEESSITSFLRENLTIDITKSLEQIDTLLTNGLLSEAELVEYCTQITDNLFFMDTSAPYMSNEKWNSTVHNVNDKLSAFDIVITDICGQIYDDLTQDIIKKSDAVVVVIEQAIDTLDKFKTWKDSSWYDALEDAGDFFVLNKFNSTVGSFPEFTRASGVQVQYCKKISEVPNLKKLANDGRLASVISKVLNKNTQYVTLNNELRDLMIMLCNNMGSLYLDWTKKKEVKAKSNKKKDRAKTRSGRIRPTEEDDS